VALRFALTVLASAVARHRAGLVYCLPLFFLSIPTLAVLLKREFLRGTILAMTSGKLALMFTESSSVLRTQWPHVKSDRALKAAYESGLEGLKKFYGKLLVIRSEMRAKNGKMRPIRFAYYARSIRRTV